MTFVSWDWGNLAIHFLWLCIGALIGAWGMALMVVARDCDRWAEAAAQQAATPAPAPAQDDGAAARLALAQANERADFYYGLYCQLLAETRQVVRRN